MATCNECAKRVRCWISGKISADDCTDFKPKPHIVTNADRIRAMSDEELACFLCDRIERCTERYCPGAETCGTEVGKGDGLKRWLQQPYKGD